MSCVVFMIHYDRTREVTVQPLVDPVTSVVFTWSSSDTPNIDMSLNIAERNITFTVSIHNNCIVSLYTHTHTHTFSFALYQVVYCTTVEVTVMVPRVKNVVELCVSDIVNQLEKAEKIRTGPRSVLVTLAGMIYSLYYIVTTPNAGCTQQEFKGFSVDM